MDGSVLGWEKLSGEKWGPAGNEIEGAWLGVGQGRRRRVCVFGLDEGHQHTRVHLTCLILAAVGAGGGCPALEAGAHTPSEGFETAPEYEP